MDPMLLILLAVFAVLIFVTFRNNKKRQQEAKNTQDKAVVGAQVMTSFGLFGTIRDIDEANNAITLESTPGTFVRVHRQTIAKIESSPVDQVTEETEGSAAEPLVENDGSPKYGVRVDETDQSGEASDHDATTEGTSASGDDEDPKKN